MEDWTETTMENVWEIHDGWKHLEETEEGYQYEYSPFNIEDQEHRSTIYELAKLRLF